MLTMNEIKAVADAVERHAELLNKPTFDNKIEIFDSKVKIIKNGKVLFEKPIATKDMNLENIEYRYNPFNSPDIAYSPFEADRSSNFVYWQQKYTKINFPAFIPIPLITWLALGKLPDIVDFCKIYLMAYTEVVTKDKYLDRRQFYATETNVYSNVKNTLTYTDGQTLQNHLIRFKDKYVPYLKNFPINQFTTEQLCNRIYKIYGSVIRDPYNMIRMREFGAKTVYDTYLDIVQGVDGIIEDIPYYGYSQTSASYDFREIKVNERHKNLDSTKGIVLEKKNKNTGGVYVMEDIAFITIISDIKKGKIEGIVKYQG